MLHPTQHSKHTSVQSQLQALVAAGIDWQTHAEPDRFPSTGTNRPAAVLILFGSHNASRAQADNSTEQSTALTPKDLDLLFVERAATMNHHPGQVAFPGGRIDSTDGGPVAAALREAVEETGLNPHGIDVLGTLPDLPLPISRHSVTPVLGWWRVPSQVRAVDAAECADVFRSPVPDLLRPENRRTTTVTRGKYAMRSPGFLVQDQLIWGFTGIVLAAIFDELGWTEPWDRSRELEIPL